MSLTIEVNETVARASKKRMEEDGLTASQILASMGHIMIDGVPHKITKLIDVDTGLEIT